MRRLFSSTTRPGWVTVLLCGLAAACVGLTGVTALGLGGPQAGGATQWVTGAVMVGAAALCFARARYLTADRHAWIAFGVHLVLFTAGYLWWSAQPSTKLADAVWLSSYVPACVGLVLLVRARIDDVRLIGWFDGLIAAFALTAGAAATVLDPAFHNLGGSFSVVAINLACPAGDLVLLACTIAVVGALGWRPERGLTLLASGFGLLIVIDSVYVVQSATGTFAGGVLTTAWPIATVLIGAAAWQPSAATMIKAKRHPMTEQIAATGFAVLVTGVIVFGLLRPMNIVAEVLTIASAAAVCARLVIAGRESLQLDQSRRQAHTDDLTGLLNRRGFYSAAEETLAIAAETHASVAFLMLDLDRFKEINDSLGHAVGDQLLEVVADRIVRSLPPESLAGRLGGDEFAVLLLNTQPGRDAHQVARAIQRSLNAPVHLAGLSCYASVSIGISVGPTHGYDRVTLMSRADIAMYQAKRTGSRVEAFSSVDGHLERNQIELASELRVAVERGDLTLHYQPKADLRTGRLDGVEVLVRWEHPRHGMIAPDVFLPIAETHGLMRQVSYHVFEKALAQQAEWRRCGHAISVAINLSPADVLDPGFPAEVAGLFQRFETPVQLVELEVTENTVMADPERVLDVLAQLRGLGVSLALDDYGTGHSSLAYLKRLPVTTLKIDRSFVKEMDATNEDATIVRSTIELARNLGMRVVAEGVETREHWEQLGSFGCDSVQGYYLSRPLPAPAFIAWLTPAAGGATAQAA